MKMVHQFNYEGNSIRVTFRDGRPFYAFADIAKAIRVRKPSVLRARILEHYQNNREARDKVSIHIGGAWFISYLGLYALLDYEQSDAAERFGRWAGITVRELPSEEMLNPEMEILRRAIVDMQKQLELLQKQIAGTTVRIWRSQTPIRIAGTPRQQLYKLVQVYARRMRVTIPVAWNGLLDVYEIQYSIDLRDAWMKYRSAHDRKISLPGYLESAGILEKAADLMRSLALSEERNASTEEINVG